MDVDEKFKAIDTLQQNALSRREVMELSHEAAKAMAELLGQGQYYSETAARGEHAGLASPPSLQQKPQEIKFFLHEDQTQPNQPKPPDEEYRQRGDPHSSADEQTLDAYSERGNPRQGEEEDEAEEEEEEELITDILERRLAYLYLPFQPSEPVEGPADTLFIVSRKSANRTKRALVRAHSQVLQRFNDAFNELIGYRPPMARTPSNEDEALDTGMATVWKESGRQRGASLFRETLEYQANERKNLYTAAVAEYEEMQEEERKKKVELETRLRVGGEAENSGPPPPGGERGSVHFLESAFLQLKRPSAAEYAEADGGRRPSQAFADDGLMNLGLESVIGNLQESQKPMLIKEFVEASDNLVKLPGWEHLPSHLKQSFEKFAESFHRYKNPADVPVPEVAPAEGGSLVSNFLGMVGRRESKEMAGILQKITRGVAERRQSSQMIDDIKRQELQGSGKDVSATVARTALERRKSQAYVENQEKRKSIAALEPRKSMALIATQDKRISPSFLERRQSKALLALAKRESAKFEEENLDMMRRRTSKAAVAAFERRKRMSILENKSQAELEFRGDFDAGWSGSQKIIPPASKDLRASAASTGLVEGRAKPATEGLAGQARRLSAASMDRRQSALGRRRSSEGFLERRGSKALIDMKEKEREAEFRLAALPAVERRPSQAPALTHTREQDRQSVIRFYEEEDEDIYNTSSSSSVESTPPPLPAGVEYVIEKMHWTSDVLHAILEFIYTEVLHIHCEELPHVNAAANEILLSSLTDAIRLKPIVHYFRLALVNEFNRKALLELANQLSTSADYQNYVNKNEDFLNLKKLCEAFSMDDGSDRKPYTLLFETAHVAFRNLPFVKSGLHTIDGEMVLILRNPREGTRLLEENQEEDEYLTFKKKAKDRHKEKPLIELHWLGKWSPLEKTRNREKAWKVHFFDFPKVEVDIPLKNYHFYKHITAITCRPWAPEEFSVRLVVGLLICPVLYDALFQSFPELDVKAARGAGYYMGGETHGNSITLTGSPRYLLQACKAIPRHMIGRTVLRVSSPSQRTFINLWRSTNRFGVDLETNALYFLKPLIQIQKILEFWHGLDPEACFPVTLSREMVELVVPHDPF